MRFSMLLRLKLLKLFRVLLKESLNFLDYMIVRRTCWFAGAADSFFLKVVLLRPMRMLTSVEVSTLTDSK